MIDGRFLIGAQRIEREQYFAATDPATGEDLEPTFSISTETDVAEACRLANTAFDSFRELVPDARAKFLETAAARIDALGDVVIERAMRESGLPRPRLTGELARTTNQLRLFADVVRKGRWAGVTFDRPLPERTPAPRADLRQRRIAAGPVAVFGASNFPLAFSVAGGDTASAFAAGCPVVVKGHPAHPGTSSLVAGAIREAVAECDLPEGTFSLLQGNSHDLGGWLVADPRIKAVGFTGSRAGGLALVEIAAGRPEPIPVYAEMSSVNPVILFPGALANRAEALGSAYVASLTLGAGQFCTNPGLVFAVDGPDLDRFVAAASESLLASTPQVMLSPSIHLNFQAGAKRLVDHAKVDVLASGAKAEGCNRGQAVILTVDAESFAADPNLAQEVFGAASIIVRASSMAELAALLEGLEGQLTVTLQLDAADYPLAKPLLPLLERKAGRILANGWPTGVEVSYAMVHGGPFPATSDARTTSVGAAAIERFLRPVCYQDLPDDLLPAALKSDNPLGLPRLIDGIAEQEPTPTL